MERRASKRSSAPVRLIGLLISGAAMFALPSCVTERSPARVSYDIRRTPATASSHANAPKTPSTADPLVIESSPAPPEASRNTASKVALRPLGLVPYDGVSLPIITTDGNHLATQRSAIDPASQEGMVIEIFDLAQSPLTSIKSNSSAHVVLAYASDSEGFFVYRVEKNRGASRVHAKCLLDGSIIDAQHPRPPDHIIRRIERAPRTSSADAYAYAFASLSISPEQNITFFDPATSRMNIWMAGEPAPIPLAPNSIAACFARTPTGPAVLVTTNQGLHLQRLSTHDTGSRAEAPVRLLREPFVVRATTNHERPYILIGPGSNTQPHTLQVVAMQIIEQ